MALEGAVSIDDIADMDFLTFDDVLKTTLQVDAAQRLANLRILNHAAQGDGDSIKALANDLMKTAYPEKLGAPQSNRPNQGVGGLRKFLGAKGALGKKKT